MTPEEVEKLIGDLEVAVDRLRSLYEQYFMGFEKLEPLVPRKDVDRRIHVLRKEQIRNTAQRFRFQMLLQRYNTFQTHWQRICREIENGTYKRHVLRAEQRFTPEAAAAKAAAVRPEPGAPVTDPEIARALAELDLDFAPPSMRGHRPSFRPLSRKPTPPPMTAVRGPAHPTPPGRPAARPPLGAVPLAPPLPPARPAAAAPQAPTRQPVPPPGLAARPVVAAHSPAAGPPRPPAKPIGAPPGAAPAPAPPRPPLPGAAAPRPGPPPPTTKPAAGPPAAPAQPPPLRRR